MNTVKKIIIGCAAILAFAGLFAFVAPAAAAHASPRVSYPAVTNGPQVCKASGDACSVFIKKYIDPFIKLLTAIVGVGATISIVMAGIRYASSADDPSAVSKAKTRIVQTLIGLLAYLFLFAFLNYIIPGGLI